MTTTTKSLYLSPIAWRRFIATGSVDLPVIWPWQSMGQCPWHARVVEPRGGSGAKILDGHGQHLFELPTPVARRPVALGRQIPRSSRSRAGVIEGMAVVERISIECVQSQQDDGPIPLTPARYIWHIELRDYERLP